MYLNVSQLLREPNGSARAYEIDETLTLLDDARPSRVSGKVRLLRTDEGIWVSAVLDSKVVCTCSRCLIEFEQPIRMMIEEEFFPVVDVMTGTRLGRTDDGEESFYIDQNHTLDLSEAARQYSALSLPMKLVCREDCAGFCLSCGVNLNERPCLCDETPVDVRWGPLLELISANDND